MKEQVFVFSLYRITYTCTFLSYAGQGGSNKGLDETGYSLSFRKLKTVTHTRKLLIIST